MEKIAQQGDQGAPSLWSHSDVVLWENRKLLRIEFTEYEYTPLLEHGFENKYSNLFGDLRPVIHRCEVPCTVIESVP